MYTQIESIQEIKKLIKADILISHDSSYHLYAVDKAHEGLRGITKYLKKNNIKLNIHGHHHINSNLVLKNKTTVICVYQCGLVDVRSKSCSVIF